MIIICKECSTKFNLDDSLLKETGSQVRCSVCKNIFTAYPSQDSGATGAAPAPSAPQSYFDSEEELGSSSLGGFQKASSEPDDDDGLELDVEEEEMEAEGLELGDGGEEFDDAGIDMGQTGPGPGLGEGINFDEDMDTDGVPGMEFDGDNSLDELDLGTTDININIDQGQDIELDAVSDMQTIPKDPEADLPELGEELETDDTAAQEGSDLDEEFEFEFELDEEEGFELEEEAEEEEIKLDISSPETEDPAETKKDSAAEPEEDFELSIYDDDLDSDSGAALLDDDKDDITLLDSDMDEQTDTEEYASMELEIDESEDDDYDEFEDDEEYEIEEFDDDQEYEDDDIIDEEYEDDEEFGKKEKKPKKKSGALLKILLLILLLLCIGLGGFKLTDGFTNFSRLNISSVKNLFNFSSMGDVPEWTRIDEIALSGSYVTNESSGKLFIITGSVINQSKLPLNNIEVVGTLIAKGGVVAKKKKVYCGNILSKEQLKTLNMGAINRILLRENGDQGKNLNIKPNQSVPFMIVFSNLPDELDNYGANVSSSKRMKNK